MVMAADVRPLKGARDNSRVQKAYRRITRFIFTHAMRPGDSLPPQQALRQEIGASNDTITAAMRQLAAEGVVTRTRRVGTVLCDLAPLTRPDWSIGLLTLPSTAHPYTAELTHRLMVEATRAGCRCTTYLRVDTPHWPQTRADFSRLLPDLYEQHIDGLLELTMLGRDERDKLEHEGVPVCHVGSWENASTGVVVDTRWMTRQAVSDLCRHGCRRPLLLTDNVAARIEDTRAYQGFCEGLVEAGRPCSPADVVCTNLGVDAGIRAARDILKRPPGNRPDAIVVTDDYVAVGLARALADSPPPIAWIAALTCKQLPLAFPLPIIRYEIDLDELAVKGVERLRERLLMANTPEGIEWVRPRPADGSGAAVPASVAMSDA